jgi:hypothetical protein
MGSDSNLSAETAHPARFSSHVVATHLGLGSLGDGLHLAGLWTHRGGAE